MKPKAGNLSDLRVPKPNQGQETSQPNEKNQNRSANGALIVTAIMLVLSNVGWMFYIAHRQQLFEKQLTNKGIRLNDNT
jgi:hypothetical protein